MANLMISIIAGIINLIGWLLQLFLSFCTFIVSYWYVFAAIGIISWIVELVTGTASSSNTKNNSIEGDYTVYDLGKPTVQVDRFHIRKD